MSTEAQKRFAVVGAHRQLHADAAKQVARLERLINEAADPDQIVSQSRELAISQAAIEIFEQHMERNHSPEQPQTAEAVQPEESTASSKPLPVPNEKNRKAIAEQIKKLTEARGSVPLAAPQSQKSHVANAAREARIKEKRNHGNTDSKQEDLYGGE